MALDLTRGGGSAGDNARRSGDSRGRKYNQIGGVEVGPVQKVEDLSAKLQAQPLTKRSVLDGREVPGCQTGAIQVVPRGVAPEPAVGWRLQEDGRIEPLRGCAENGIPSEVWIGERPDGIARVSVVGR